jgi:hypothetical protein
LGNDPDAQQRGLPDDSGVAVPPALTRHHINGATGQGVAESNWALAAM